MKRYGLLFNFCGILLLLVYVLNLFIQPITALDELETVENIPNNEIITSIEIKPILSSKSSWI